jgi:hypothetical protein
VCEPERRTNLLRPRPPAKGLALQVELCLPQAPCLARRRAGASVSVGPSAGVLATGPAPTILRRFGRIARRVCLKDGTIRRFEVTPASPSSRAGSLTGCGSGPGWPRAGDPPLRPRPWRSIGRRDRPRRASSAADDLRATGETGRGGDRAGRLGRATAPGRNARPANLVHAHSCRTTPDPRCIARTAPRRPRVEQGAARLGQESSLAETRVSPWIQNGSVR